MYLVAAAVRLEAVARLVRLMAMAVRFSAKAMKGRDGTAAKIAHVQDLVQQRGAPLFQASTRVGHREHLLT